MIRDAVTCDRTGCIGLHVEPDGMADDYFETHVLTAVGWAYDPVGGHTCPACQRGNLVIERGECPRCGGAVFNRAADEKCHYCGHEMPFPPEEYDEDEEEFPEWMS